MSDEKMATDAYIRALHLDIAECDGGIFRIHPNNLSGLLNRLAAKEKRIEELEAMLKSRQETRDVPPGQTDRECAERVIAGAMKVAELCERYVTGDGGDGTTKALSEELHETPTGTEIIAAHVAARVHEATKELQSIIVALYCDERPADDIPCNHATDEFDECSPCLVERLKKWNLSRHGRKS